MTIRLAVESDLTVMNDIYNHYVSCSTATYQEAHETMEARRLWFLRHDAAHPVIVAASDGRIVGWGSLSPFHGRSAYRHTVENSVYVDPDWQRRGVGRALLANLIERAKEIGHRTLIAGIDADQAPSIALHAALGFVEVGRLRQAGLKFDRWLDVLYMQLML